MTRSGTPVGMCDVVLRRPMLADVEQTAEVHVRSWQVGYRDLMPADFLAGLDPAHRVRQQRGSWGDPALAHVRGLVAEHDGRVVGFVRHGPYRTDHERGWRAADPAAGGEVYALYVHPDHWEAGIGGLLLDAAVAELRNSDLVPIRVWTLAGNQRALRFYRAHGFVPDGQVQPIELGQTEKITLPEERLTLHP